MSDKVQCAGITKTGKQCSRNVPRSQKVCKTHENSVVYESKIPEEENSVEDENSESSESESGSDSDSDSETNFEVCTETKFKNDSDLIKSFQNLYKFT